MFQKRRRRRPPHPSRPPLRQQRYRRPRWSAAEAAISAAAALAALTTCLAFADAALPEGTVPLSLVHSPLRRAKSLPSVAGSVDLVDVLNLASTPPGIETSTGMCEARPTDDEGDSGDPSAAVADTAFKISSRAVASVPTAQVFPGGFPADFSVLATFRADQNSKSTLLAVYSDEGELVFTIKVGRRMRMVYKGQISRQARKIKFGPNLSDGK